LRVPDFAEPVERLIDQLKHLPGIGAKTAQRLAFHILRIAPEDALALADAIRDAKLNMRFCSRVATYTGTRSALYIAAHAQQNRMFNLASRIASARASASSGAMRRI